MGLAYNIYLNDSRIYGCKVCNTHLSNYTDIISRVSESSQLIRCTECYASLRQFRGQHGKAYLFDKVVNVTEAKPENRSMTTGEHTVRDIHCRHCGTCVGWKYDHAYEQSEKYKEGKYILEVELLVHVK
ncbi:Yippee/Mis18 [Lipomyces starkeyi]